MAVSQGSPCSPSQASAEGKKSPNKDCSWIQLHFRGATLTRELLKRGQEKGKGYTGAVSTPLSAVLPLHPPLPSTLIGTDSLLVF